MPHERTDLQPHWPAHRRRHRIRRPDRQVFQPRPTFAIDSTAGGFTIQLADGCTYTASGSNNLGPNNATLTTLITAMRTNMAAFDCVDGATVTASQVAADAVTESGSDVEPYILPLPFTSPRNGGTWPPGAAWLSSPCSSYGLGGCCHRAWSTA
ncbi:potassium-transporting ATPase subunit C [Actinospica robiniae]|uniref:potassium-transporting ATPase subunit C n=1 Tax=Actinospica robiniae TaxID=304901 RepID=UPI000405EABB|nr:potassium-transporting ATPase subunit C [Actinospica robiniae]